MVISTAGGRLVEIGPVSRLMRFGEYAMELELRFWITDPSQGLTNVRGNVYLALWDTFKANGIAIPFPQRELRLTLDDAQLQRIVGAAQD